MYNAQNPNNFGMSSHPKKAHNPFETINTHKGLDETHDFERDPSQTMNIKATHKVSDEIDRLMRDKVYEVIRTYQNEVGSMMAEAEPHHTRKVLKKFLSTLTDDECDKFHKSISDGGVCYYKEALLFKYAPVVKDASSLQRDPRLKAELEDIKKKIYAYMKSKKWDLETLFRVIDKDNSKGISASELVEGTSEYLTQQEATTLFRAIDVRGGNDIHISALKAELI